MIAALVKTRDCLPGKNPMNKERNCPEKIAIERYAR
jgi:hypothetical protein